MQDVAKRFTGLFVGLAAALVFAIGCSTVFAQQAYADTTALVINKKVNGQVKQVETYTTSELYSMAKRVGSTYEVSASTAKGTQKVYTTKYIIRLSELFSDAGLKVDDEDVVTASQESSSGNVVSSYSLDYGTMSAGKFYPDTTAGSDNYDSSNASAVPACLAMSYSESVVASGDTLGETETTNNGNLNAAGGEGSNMADAPMLFFGNTIVSGDDVDSTLNGDDRLVKNVNVITVEDVANGDGKYSLNYADFTVPSVTWNKGAAVKSPIVVKYGSTTLVEGTDYTTSFSNNTAVGTATVTISGKGNYAANVSKSYKVTQKNISELTCSLSSTTYTYDGYAKKPGVTLKFGSTTLKSGTDYTVSYSGNVNAGTAKATITGKGNYTGTITKNFTIKKAPQKFTVSKLKKSESQKKVVDAAKTLAKINVSGAKGKVTFVKTGGSSHITMSKNTSGRGKILMGTPRGTFKITVKVTAAETANYAETVKYVTLTVKVKK